jgi:hypothetical protein
MEVVVRVRKHPLPFGKWGNPGFQAEKIPLTPRERKFCLQSPEIPDSRTLESHPPKISFPTRNQ